MVHHRLGEGGDLTDDREGQRSYLFVRQGIARCRLVVGCGGWRHTGCWGWGGGEVVAR